MLTRDRELKFDRLELVSADAPRRGREPVGEQGLDLCVRGEFAVMIEIDVRDHRDLGAQGGDCPIGLVALDHQPASAGPRVPAQLRYLTADQEARIVAQPV